MATRTCDGLSVATVMRSDVGGDHWWWRASESAPTSRTPDAVI